MDCNVQEAIPLKIKSAFSPSSTYDLILSVVDEDSLFGKKTGAAGLGGAIFLQTLFVVAHFVLSDIKELWFDESYALLFAAGNDEELSTDIVLRLSFAAPAGNEEFTGKVLLLNGIGGAGLTGTLLVIRFVTIGHVVLSETETPRNDSSAVLFAAGTGEEFTAKVLLLNGTGGAGLTGTLLRISFVTVEDVALPITGVVLHEFDALLEFGGNTEHFVSFEIQVVALGFFGFSMTSSDAIAVSFGVRIVLVLNKLFLISKNKFFK